MNIKEMPQLLGLSVREFARRYGIPYRTMQRWYYGETQVPKYILSLLERAVLEDASKEKDGEN